VEGIGVVSRAALRPPARAVANVESFFVARAASQRGQRTSSSPRTSSSNSVEHFAHTYS